MSAVIEYDKNDPRTWPKEEVDGKYVIYKAKKNYGLYEYEVSRTKTFKKPLDCVLAWMRIPTNLKRFGEPPIKDMPGHPNPIIGDIGILENAEYIYDGETWLYIKDLDEFTTDEKLKEEVRPPKTLQRLPYERYLRDGQKVCLSGNEYVYDRKLDLWVLQEKNDKPQKPQYYGTHTVEHDRAFAEPISKDDVDRMREDMMRKIYYDKKDKSQDCPKKCVCIDGWLVIVIFALGLFFGLFIRVNLVV